MSKVLVPLANGFEEIEAFTIIDVLKRSGVNVIVASAHESLQVVSAHDLTVIADCLIDDCIDDTYDLIALPGGMPGAENLSKNENLISMLKNQRTAGRLFAAICASPAVVLQVYGLLDGYKATCYPGMGNDIAQFVSDKTVVVDRNCVTSQGPGTAFAFALKLVEMLVDQNKAMQLAKGMLVR